MAQHATVIRSPRAKAALSARRGIPAASTSDDHHSVLPSVKKHRTLEELAYLDIRQAIAEGRFAPGERIVVSSLAAASGVSRIPVMQALRRLETEGFVRITPHKDVVVASPSPEEFRERFLLMAALEALCLRESVGKLTPAVVRQLRVLQAELVAARRAKDTARAATLDGQFHLQICETAGLPQTLQLFRNLLDRGEYYRLIMHARRGGFAKESLEEHEKILRALEADDLSGAVKAIEAHRLGAMQRLAATT
jgi:DNA-binding GntR family transcriptional regulator